MTGDSETSGSRCNLARRGLEAIARRAIPLLPERYRTPTADYALQKALKDVTSRVFLGLDRIGLHLLPKHFYSPVADYAWLRANRRYWDQPASMTGVRWDLNEQMEWLRSICLPYIGEVAGLASIDAITRDRYGPGFGPIDAQVLHCAMRSLAPARVVEIGSGVSTVVMLGASGANVRDGRRLSRITTVDPNPTAELSGRSDVRVIRDFAQRVPMDVFEQLRDGDLLFIDSSHAVKVGSEVVRLFLDVIPKLPAGVIIHVHDVSLPYLYPRSELSDFFGWQETTLLLALMTGNPGLRPLASLSALHYDRTEELRKLLPDYRPQENDAGMRTGNWAHSHFPDSMWIRVT